MDIDVGPAVAGDATVTDDADHAMTMRGIADYIMVRHTEHEYWSTDVKTWPG